MSSGDFYFNKTGKNYISYRNLMTKTITLLNGPNETMDTDVDDILEFETKLANISLTFEKTGGAAYQRMPLNKLSKLVPKINWQNYFNLTIPLAVNETESIGIFGFDYFLDVQDIVETIPERIIKNYLLWRFVMNRIKNLDSRFENILEDYYRDQYGTKSIPARWKKCIDFVNGNLGTAVSALYVRKYFDLQSKHKAEEMIKNIKKEFMLILDEVEWMDDETRNDAKKKAEMMEEHIGFPDYILDPKALDKDFEHLEFGNITYFENVVGYLKNSTKKSQGKLSSTDDRTK
ncbi:neprilysin-like protein 2 [Sarcoptes scabiei]|nr:neprilysin-like protein 2 [Sarcoptes scabiei]